MEETQAPADQPTQAASPPAADAPATEAFEARPDLELAADFQNIDAVIEAARSAAEAEGESETLETTPPPPVPAVASSPPPAPDYSRTVEELTARGYSITPPTPPPDPFASLSADLEPLVGSAEQYQQAREAALAPLPPLPSDTDPAWQQKFDAHAQAVAEREAAAQALQLYDKARGVANVSRGWARQRVLGEIGAALESLPQVYGLSAEQAKRVVEPTAMTDAVAAVVEARDAYWQAQLAERERHWQGEVKRASVDRSVESLQRIGRGASPTSPPGGRPAGTLAGLFSSGGEGASALSEDVIERAMRGELAGMDLSGE